MNVIIKYPVPTDSLSVHQIKIEIVQVFFSLVLHALFVPVCRTAALLYPYIKKGCWVENPPSV